MLITLQMIAKVCVRWDTRKYWAFAEDLPVDVGALPTSFQMRHANGLAVGISKTDKRITFNEAPEYMQEQPDRVRYMGSDWAGHTYLFDIVKQKRNPNA